MGEVPLCRRATSVAMSRQVRRVAGFERFDQLYIIPIFRVTESVCTTPCTLHSAPNTLHPTPYTLHPTPYTLHPTLYTLHPTSYTLLHPHIPHHGVGLGCRA